jgi:hypothetical protein
MGRHSPSLAGLVPSTANDAVRAIGAPEYRALHRHGSRADEGADVTKDH